MCLCVAMEIMVTSERRREINKHYNKQEILRHIAVRRSPHARRSPSILNIIFKFKL